jgi:hypothetical protein
MPTTYFLPKIHETRFVSNPTAVLVSCPPLPPATGTAIDVPLGLTFSNHRNVDASAASAAWAATNATAITTTTGSSDASSH